MAEQSIRYVCSAKDYMAAQAIMMDRSSAHRSHAARTRAHGLLFVAAMAVFFFVQQHWISGAIILATTPLVYVLYPRVIRHVAMQSFREALRERDAAYFGEQELILSEDGIIQRSKERETLYRWPAIREVVRSTNGQELLLINVHPLAHVVPRSGVVAGDFCAFIVQLASRVPVVPALPRSQ